MIRARTGALHPTRTPRVPASGVAHALRPRVSLQEALGCGSRPCLLGTRAGLWCCDFERWDASPLGVVSQGSANSPVHPVVCRPSDQHLVTRRPSHTSHRGRTFKVDLHLGCGPRQLHSVPVWASPASLSESEEKVWAGGPHSVIGCGPPAHHSEKVMKSVAR